MSSQSFASRLEDIQNALARDARGRAIIEAANEIPGGNNALTRAYVLVATLGELISQRGLIDSQVKVGNLAELLNRTLAAISTVPAGQRVLAKVGPMATSNGVHLDAVIKLAGCMVEEITGKPLLAEESGFRTLGGSGSLRGSVAKIGKSTVEAVLTPQQLADEFQRKVKNLCSMAGIPASAVKASLTKPAQAKDPAAEYAELQREAEAERNPREKALLAEALRMFRNEHWGEIHKPKTTQRK